MRLRVRRSPQPCWRWPARTTDALTIDGPMTGLEVSLTGVPELCEIAADMNANAPERERRTFDAVPSSARAARQFVTALLHSSGAPVGVIGDYSLVVSELVTNVIEHSDGSEVEIIVDVADPDWWGLEVVGGAPAASKRMTAPETWAVAGAHEVAGRGLGIVRQLMDDVVTDVVPDQISVRCRVRRSTATQ